MGGALIMDSLNTTILSPILPRPPLAGAILVALFPEKLARSIALLTPLVTFLFTLHLPARYILGLAVFQFIQYNSL